MKKISVGKAMHKWLFLLCSLLILAGLPARIYAQEGIGGGYVVDPAITVPANSYTTFSMVYNGKRYYLGVDTTAAKSGVDTIAIYDKPCYAAMWIAGPLWSPTGRELANKDYTRTVKSVWIAERITGRAKKEFLSVGPDKRNYSPLVLTDTANSTLWHTAKDFTVQSQYMHGFTYAYSDDGTETYRYLAYDPVYGFSRLYAMRPTTSQRISVWDRTTGRDVTCTLTPPTYAFGLNEELDTVKLPITSQVLYYSEMDRFRSRYDQTDIIVSRSTPIDNQKALVEAPYEMYGYYEWASNPRVAVPTKEEILLGDKGYNGYSLMTYFGMKVDKHDKPEDPTQWTYGPDTVKSPVIQVKYGKFSRDDVNKLWHDTVYALGTSPFNIHEAVWNRETSQWEEGGFMDHSDWLRQHYWIKACAECEYEHFVDSIRLVRNTFHSTSKATLASSTEPIDHVFPYYAHNGDSGKDTIVGGTDVTWQNDTVFEVSAHYTELRTVRYTNNTVAQTDVREDRNIDIASLPCHRDTIWTTDPTPAIDHINLYDTLIVQALNTDGSPATWLHATVGTGANRNKITVTADPYDAGSVRNRVAKIQYRYCFRHSSAVGDTVEVVRTIWLTQLWRGAKDATLYTFNHKYGKGYDEANSQTNAGNPGKAQPVHTKKQTLYAIPGENLQLPIHRDYWGFYRWYEWNGTNPKAEVDVANSRWTWGDAPLNQESPVHRNFMPINNVKDASSRGRWDMNYSGHFVPGEPTPIPSVRYPGGTAESITKVDSIACDVSAYMDIDTHGNKIDSLEQLTEPTLSYRNIFYVRPAKEQADKMQDCRVNGGDGHNGWMESHYVLAPAGRAFSLQQQYPVQDADGDAVDEEHLQYIYYFNPDATGTEDNNMGTPKDGVSNQTAACYARIGKKYRSGVTKRSAHLLTVDSIRAMGNGTRRDVVLVNVIKNPYGYIVGEANEDPIYWSFPDSVTNVTKLKHFVENAVLNPRQSGYTFSLKKVGNYESNQADIIIYKEKETNPLMYYWGYHNSWYPTNWVAWVNGNGSNVSGTMNIAVGHYKPSDNTSWQITGNDAAMSSLYFYDRSRYLSSVNSDGDNQEFFVLSDQSIRTAWYIFAIDEPVEAEHYETPIWEYSTDRIHWDPVADKSTANSRYTMLADGSLSVGSIVHTTPGQEVYYRLRTEHFNLANYTVWTTNPATDGPSATTILSEDSIQNHYEILYTLGNDLFPAPNTRSPKAYYHHMPWSFSELAYHYPVGTGDHEIPESERVYSSILPARGEYAYINKFVEPGNSSNVVEPLGGAEHGYMMCINVPQKPITIFDFEYPMIPCADQNIFLTVDLCNPVDNDNYRPQITADLLGTSDNGVTWETIYRYKTGEIPYNASQRWYQLVLPINQTYLEGFDRFRCVATMPGSMSDTAYVLIDRMRFIAKERPVNIFQNKSTCLDRNGSGVVDIIARLDYKNATYPAGTHFAYQYQKKVGDTFVPLKTSGVEAPDIAVNYANDLVDTLLLDVNGKGCGVITMPLPTYTPTAPAGDNITTVDGVTAHLKSYVNEGTDEHAYYVMYISEPVYAHAGDTFRVAMTTISSASDKPDFADAGCAMERLIPIHNPVELHVNGSATEWTNYTREQINANPSDGIVAVPANATYTVTAEIGSAFLPTAGTGKCMFDVVRTTVADTAFKASDEWFKKRFGCTRTQFREIMTIFRADDDRNRMRLETNWNNVRPEMFQYSGRTKEQADSIYTILNRLIVDSAFIEIGKSSYDIYMGENNNAYVVLWPIPASGQYEDASTHKISPISVCSTPRWFEIHSAATSTASLRFGYDNMFEGDYYILPIVRASQKDANSSLKVRLAEITHAEEESGTVAVMKWNATELIETNDTAWHSAVFKYCQDKDVRTAVEGHIAVADYYRTGDEVTFTPAAGNAYTLKAGYWYKFHVPYYAATVGGTFTEGESVGNAEFVLAVAPDTVRWTPSHPEQTNYWNDDNNWTPVMANVPADGFKARVPMNGTKVIIPQTEEGQLPVVSEFVVNNQDLRDFGYQKNTCEKILFKPRAQMLGQEKLSYEKAFVDVHFTTGEWQTFSPALDNIYAGDMYIPYSRSYNKNDSTTGRSIDTEDFNPKPFPWTSDCPSGYNPREYPFAFYQGFYNAAVPVPFYNTDKENNALDADSAKSKSTVDWVNTPSMAMEYKPGAPCVIQGFDATDADGRDIVVRLPKQETTYYGYGRYGGSYIAGGSVSIGARATEHNLAYDKYDHDTIGTLGINYTLKNATPADLFFFGNPTMALVDVYKLCEDNADVLKHGVNTYYFTAYQLMNGSNYVTKTITGPGQYFIAPQRAIGLIAKDTCSSLTIKLKPSHLVAITGDGIVVSNPDIASGASGAPKRIARTKTVYEEPEKRWLYITASNETDWGVRKSYLTLGEQTGANRGYVFGEDALNISSGLNYNEDAEFSTPLTLYTIADNQALMQDVRDTLVRVPLIFTTLQDYSYDQYTMLSFKMSGTWDKPLYLYDALTEDSILIRNGLQVAVRTPNSDQIRYFINGERTKGEWTNGENQQGNATGVEVVNDQQPISNEPTGTIIYDVLGRRVMTLTEYDLISNTNLPTGVYIIQRGNKTERMVIR